MAKKLIRDYVFVPGAATEGYVAIPDYYPLGAILLITNVTDNVIIYNFADPTKGGTTAYNSLGGTDLALNFDTSSMSSDDELQVFVDDRSVETDFNEAYVDPVNKLRVSTPENLIDTDFEYGLQPAKWETLELVNNIPAFYPTQSDVTLEDVSSVNTLNGSDLVTVTTTSPHGLPIGTPIDIRGLSSYTAEGKYLVTAVPTDYTFTYKAKNIQSDTKDVSGAYTVVVPGEFYTASNLAYNAGSGIQTDELTPSSLTISTDYSHGLEVGTSVYLTNTVGAKIASVTNTLSDNAPDGRPYVDFEDTATTNVAATSSLTETREKKGVWNFKFNADAVDTGTGEIAWTNSSLAAGDALLYTAPPGDTAIGGLATNQVYYVKAVSATGITLCETTNGNYSGNPAISFSSTGTYDFGRGELMLVYEVKQMRREMYTSTATVTTYRTDIFICRVFDYAFSFCTSTTTVTRYNTGSKTNIFTRRYIDGAGSGRDLANSGQTSSSNTSRAGHWGISGLDPERWVLIAKTGTPKAGVWNGFVYGPSYNANFTLGNTSTTPTGYEFVEDFTRYESFGGTAAGTSSSNRLEAYTGGAFRLNNIGSGNATNQTSDPTVTSGSYGQDFAAGTYFLCPLMVDPEGDTISIPDNGYIENDTVTLTTNTGSDIVTTGNPTSLTGALPTTTLTSPVTFQVQKVTSSRVRIKQSGSTKKISSAAGTYTASRTGVNTFADSIYFEEHGFQPGQTTQISSTGGTLPTLSTSTPNPKANGQIARAIFLATEDALDTMITSITTAGDNVNLFVNGDSAKNPFVGGSTTVSGGTYNFSRAFNNINVQIDNNIFSGTATLPSDNTWSSGQPFDFMNSTSLAGTGFNLVQSNYEKNSEVPYWISVVEIPDPTKYGGNEVQVVEAFSSSTSSMGSRSVSNNNNTSASWTTVAGGSGWRYTFDGIYIQASTSASGSHGLFQLALTLDNSNHPGYDATYSSYSITTPGTLHTSVSGFGGQRYQIHVTLPIKAGAATSEYGISTGSVLTLDAMASNIASQVATNLVAATYSGAVTDAEVTVIDNNRFTLSTTNGIPFNFTNSGTQPLEFTFPAAIGALDGTHEVSAVTSNSFDLLQTVKVPKRSISFIAADVTQTGGVTLFNIDDHSLDFGQAIEFDDPNTLFTGLTDGTTYYAIPHNKDHFSIAATQVDAVAEVSLNLTAPGSGTFSWIVPGINGLNPGPGTVTITSGSSKVTGDNDVLFKQYFKDNDQLFAVDTSVTPNRVRTLNISSVVSNGEINLTQPAEFSSATTNYLVRTNVFVRPDGTFLHRPFDGGVEITCGQSPNSSIIRQTRKYFRYQSGKGIQCSIAVNFNPARLINSLEAVGNVATIRTLVPHNLNVGDQFTVRNSTDDQFNGQYGVSSKDTFSFSYELPEIPNNEIASGIPEYVPTGWQNAAVRAGMFDEQNGFFYEFDGQQLYAVRRSSTQQISGTASITYGSNSVTGVDTKFATQLAARDKVVIRGQSYLVTDVVSNTEIHIQPTYRGVDQSGVVLTKTVDTRVAQSNWNLDKSDGTGPSGFVLDTTRIQMIYMDYAWYGAGKIRFGFKDAKGKVMYAHEFIHNNKLNEAYMRSGNLPCRYQIENVGAPSYVPTLFHWGTSVIMDGDFDDDKAYLFTAASNSLTYTAGLSLNATTVATSSLIGRSTGAWWQRTTDWYVKVPFNTADASKFSTGVSLFGGTLNGQTVAFTDYADGNFNCYIFIQRSRNSPSSASYPTVASGTQVGIGAPVGGTSDDLEYLATAVPLVSIRLAPSVDNNLTGVIGQRDIINRMQLQLKQLGLTTTHDTDIELILNGSLNTIDYQNVQTPSLSNLIKHEKGDTVIGGTPLFTLRASGGAVDSGGTRLSNTVDFDLSQISDLGNSILGGDGVFPNGPDVLTIAARIVDTAEVDSTSPYRLAGRLTWTESQA